MYRLPEFDHADLWSMTRKCVANIKKIKGTFALIRVDVILQHESVDDSLDTFPSLLCVSNPHQ